MKPDNEQNNSGMKIPDYQLEAIARCLLPKIQEYYESDIGKKDLAEYRAEKAKQPNVVKKTQTNNMEEQ